MKKVSVILFILGISIITIANSAENVGKHVQRTIQFSCKPQLRSIPVRELLTEQYPNVHYFPPSTVLARCDEHSGCCLDDKVCTVVEKTNVELVFSVDPTVNKNSQMKYLDILTAENHTRCHCVNRSTLI